ncbi:hypothetical protein PCCS19_36220 [Paenibacillus sp. CCS19]|uniref:zinc-ribbon domain-containing protein n=1 Tax=Paenibacillus sp. CCS19 TaxID=3158387 RepID=UPI00256C9499|nr:zinc-ribbon domain-containing protein [Paenibacillus cellulosilyticus]GMK40566.1 hypothetical protein PCCS19_36220 [Paenibacillus cellulosilyticus]
MEKLYYTIRDLMEFAQSKGGSCLSFEYVAFHHPYKWRCEQGHVWEAPFSRIRSGSWCRECHLKYQRQYPNTHITIVDLHKLAKSKDGQCLSEAYINSHHKYQWKCKEGHTWEAPYSRIKRGGWCPECNVVSRAERKRKYTIEDMRGLAKKQGGECLSEKFISVSKKFIWKCAKGHIWEAIAIPIMSRNVWCPICARERAGISRRFTIEDAQNIAAIRGGYCLSDSYINCKSQLLWKCTEGHEWVSTFDNISSGSWCKACAGLEGNTIEDAQKLAEQRNGKCLSSVLKNSKEKLAWVCAEGHRWDASYGNIHKGTWCPTCAGTVKNTLHDAQLMARSRGGRCLSDTYVNAHEKLKWECANGHIFEKNYNNVQQGNWCSQCLTRLNEQKTRFIFEALLEKKFPTNWVVLGNYCQLDGYNEELKLAFEFQGIQHYEEYPYYHRNRGDFEAQTKRDEEKRQLCKELGIVLIEIKYTLKTDQEKINYIHNFLNENNYQVNTKEDVLERMKDFYKVNAAYLELVQIAEERKGELLSENYLGAHEKLLWSCEKSHEWLAAPTAIKGGSWCPECKKHKIGDTKRIYTIDIVKEFAVSKGGECASEEYKSVTQRLEWKCSEGHTWKANFGAVKSGTWCPYCAGNVMKTIKDAQALAAKKEGLCLSLEYKGAFGKLTWKCRCGHVWDTTYHQVDSGGWCPECAKESRAKLFRKYSIEDMRAIAAEKNGDCLSEAYESCNKKLLWKCQEGHEFGKTLSNLKRGQWCPFCSKER